MTKHIKEWHANRMLAAENKAIQNEMETKLTVVVGIVKKHLDQGNAPAVREAMGLLDDNATKLVMERLDHVDRMFILALIGAK